MTTDQLHAMHTSKPFIPFDIAMADGTRYHVPHPELAYVKGTRTCVVYDTDGIARILDLLLMTALEASNPKSGKRRRAG
jgi:hypothetical protein